MAGRKYVWDELTEKQLDDLAQAYPFAVETVTIRKPVYKVIAMLLGCKVKVPGITLKEPEKAPLSHGGRDKED